MAGLIQKACKAFAVDCRSRGLYFATLMSLVQIVGLGRGFFYKLVYFRNIRSSIFSLQANSTIEIFNKRAQVRIGKFVFIRKNVSLRIDGDGELTVAEKVFINDNCTINCAHKISIGRSTKIAPNVCINDHDHNFRSSSEGHLLKEEVIIGEHVWIGSNVVILRGSVIGDHAVIGAGSIVKGTVPARTVFLNKRENKLIAFDHAGSMQPVR